MNLRSDLSVLTGCQFDAGSDSVPRCPAGRPVCNTETHHCQAQSGSTRLEKLVFTSHSCEGCTREGLNMSLAGSDMLLPQPRCKTVDLDHPDLPDFQSSSTFLANVAEQDLGWGNCWKVVTWRLRLPRLTSRYCRQLWRAECWRPRSSGLARAPGGRTTSATTGTKSPTRSSSAASLRARLSRTGRPPRDPAGQERQPPVPPEQQRGEESSVVKDCCQAANLNFISSLLLLVSTEYNFAS